MQRTLFLLLAALLLCTAAPANARQFMNLQRDTAQGGMPISRFMPLKEARRTAFRPPLRAREDKKQQVEEDLQQLAALGRPDLKTALDRQGETEQASLPVTHAERRKKTKKGAHLWPVPASVEQRLSSGYGSRLHPVTRRRAFHTGIDIAAAKGAPVLASEAGTVASVGAEGNLGNAIRIDHEDGSYSVYGHLSRMRVKEGDRVGQGEVIGNVGATGRATGPHLHYMLKVGGKSVDPLSRMQEPPGERVHLADGA